MSPLADQLLLESRKTVVAFFLLSVKKFAMGKTY